MYGPMSKAVMKYIFGETVSMAFCRKPWRRRSSKSSWITTNALHTDYSLHPWDRFKVLFYGWTGPGWKGAMIGSLSSAYFALQTARLDRSLTDFQSTFVFKKIFKKKLFGLKFNLFPRGLIWFWQKLYETGIKKKQTMFSSWKHALFADVNVRCCQSIQNKTIIMKPFLN